MEWKRLDFNRSAEHQDGFSIGPAIYPLHVALLAMLAYFIYFRWIFVSLFPWNYLATGIALGLLNYHVFRPYATLAPDGQYRRYYQILGQPIEKRRGTISSNHVFIIPFTNRFRHRFRLTIEWGVYIRVDGETRFLAAYDKLDNAKLIAELTLGNIPGKGRVRLVPRVIRTNDGKRLVGSGG